MNSVSTEDRKLGIEFFLDKSSRYQQAFERSWGCPTCDAIPGQGCRTSSDKWTGIHQTRRGVAWQQLADALRKEEPVPAIVGPVLKARLWKPARKIGDPLNWMPMSMISASLQLGDGVTREYAVLGGAGQWVATLVESAAPQHSYEWEAPVDAVKAVFDDHGHGVIGGYDSLEEALEACKAHADEITAAYIEKCACKDVLADEDVLAEAS